MDRIPRARRPGAQLTWLAAALVAATLLAFVGGQWAADTALAPRGLEPASPVATAPAPAVDRPAPAGPSAAPAAAPAALAAADEPPAPQAAPPGRPTPAVVARVAEEASLALERAREDLRARCVPAGRPAGSGLPARFTFNITFDASGREIARGISEDRRARDPEVAGCLRRLPFGTLRVTAPGANVGVRVAMSLP